MRGLMRRVEAALAIVMLIVGASVGVSAVAEDYQPWPNHEMFSQHDGDSWIGVLECSSLNSGQLHFYREWRQGDYSMLFYNPSSGYLTFVMVDKDFESLADISVDSLNRVCFASKSGDRTKLCYSTLIFNGHTGKHIGGQYGVPAEGDACFALSSTPTQFGYLLTTSWSGLNGKGLPDAVRIKYEGKLWIVDDLDGNSSSGADPDLDPNPVPPRVPSDRPDMTVPESEYVPYDTSIWIDVLDYLRSAMGAAVHYIVLIIFLLSVPSLIFSVVRHFISQGKANGKDLI